MPSFRDERRVRHRAIEMFDLVADVERYPEFVPLCKALRVRSRKGDGDGRETLIAGMTVGYKLISETFTSRVTLDKPRLKVRSNISTGRSAISKTSGPSGTRSRTTARGSISSSTTSSRAARSGRSWARCSTSPSANSPAPSNSAPTRSIGARKAGLGRSGVEKKEQYTAGVNAGRPATPGSPRRFAPAR